MTERTDAEPREPDAPPVYRKPSYIAAGPREVQMISDACDGIYHEECSGCDCDCHEPDDNVQETDCPHCMSVLRVRIDGPGEIVSVMTVACPEPRPEVEALAEGWTAQQWMENALYWMDVAQEAQKERDHALAVLMEHAASASREPTADALHLLSEWVAHQRGGIHSGDIMSASSGQFVAGYKQALDDIGRVTRFLEAYTGNDGGPSRETRRYEQAGVSR